MARREADGAGQAVEAAGERGEADLGFGQGEGGVVRREDDVGGERDFKAAAHGDTVDRGDDRLVEVPARGEAAKAGGAAR